MRWAEWTRKQECTKLYGLGESLGAAVLIQAAAIRPAFVAIAAESSYADLPSIGRYRVARMSHLPGPIAAPLSPIFVEGTLLYWPLPHGLAVGHGAPAPIR